jgi:multicomponent Na+:H+ antiporter subunit F
MGAMSAWLIAATILLAALVLPGIVCVRRPPMDALVALELSGVVVTLVFALLAEGYHRQPFMDLAIVLALMTFVGSLAFARLLERWV